MRLTSLAFIIAALLPFPLATQTGCKKSDGGAGGPDVDPSSEEVDASPGPTTTTTQTAPTSTSTSPSAGEFAGAIEIRIDEGPVGAPGFSGGDATFYDPKTPDDVAAVAKEGTEAMKRWAFPGVAFGTCEEGDLGEPDTSPGPSAASKVDVGASIDVLPAAGGAPHFTMARASAENMYSGGGDKFADFKVGPFMPRIGGPTITPRTFSFWPRAATGLTEGFTISKATGFTMTYGAVTAQSYTMMFGLLNRFTCLLNPAGGTLELTPALLSKLQTGSTTVEFKMRGWASDEVDAGGKKLSVMTFRMLSFSIGGTLN